MAKEKRILSDLPLPPEKKEPETIQVTLASNDDCFERGRKIFRLIGLADRLGLSQRAAEYIEAYRKLDREAAVMQYKHDHGIEDEHELEKPVRSPDDYSEA